MLRTPLIDFHRRAGARLTEFAGWEMPLLYTSIIEEHHYTRQHASMFDVSHMGRVEFRGPDAETFLERLSARRVGDMQSGVCRYSHLCRDDGGILDDVIISRFEDHFLVVCNAANREKLLGWFERQKQAGGFKVQIDDRTLETAMVAVQGPEAVDTLADLLSSPLQNLKRYHFTTGQVFGATYYVARTGYTGEDGVEIILPAALAHTAATMLVERTADAGRPVRPAGLGARDTLRLEAAMPLYGHELSEEWDPITAGQGWVVSLEKDFIGKQAIERVKKDGPQQVLVGFEVHSRRTPRQGAAILYTGAQIGRVTSGTMSPTLGRVIAMGFVPPTLREPGTQVEMDLRGTCVPAHIVPLPFYRRAKKK